jgi:hypothetical protein
MGKNQTDQQRQQTDERPQTTPERNEKETGTARAFSDNTDKKHQAQSENKKLQDSINPKEDGKRDDKRNEKPAGEKSWQKK